MNNEKSNALVRNSTLNMYGTIFYYACQWLTTIVVARLAGFASAGVYALAISFVNIFGFISRWGVRNYQISDIEHRHTDGTYLATRAITCGGSFLIFLLCLPFMQFSSKTLWCSVVLCLFKLLESVTDVFFGIFQKLDRYNAIAGSFTLKGLLPLAIFGIILWAGLSIVVACLGMTLAYLATLLFYDLPVLLRSQDVTHGVSKTGIKTVIYACTPLMVFSLVNPYMTFITRYSIQRLFSEVQLGYYSSISMVIVVMTTLAGSIFAVVIPRASTLYQQGQKKPLIHIVFRMVLGIAGVTGVALLAGYFLGSWALGLVFGQEILPYSYLLLPMILVSGLLTLVAFFSSMLTAFQKRTSMLLANVAGAVVCTVLAWPFAKSFGMIGACWCLVASMLVQGGLLAWIAVKVLHNKEKWIS